MEDMLDKESIGKDDLIELLGERATRVDDFVPASATGESSEGGETSESSDE